MSVLIKGLNMPKSCGECIFEIFGGCHINLNTEPKNKLTHSCPLIEIPDHGDLIDRDILLSKVQKWYWEALETVRRMPPVVPAERGKK